MIVSLTLLLLLAGGPSEGPETSTRKTLSFPNFTVQDQDGKQLKFRDDLIADKVVALQFIFTSCPTICPPMGANFADLQKKLVASGHPEVALISVSIDPSTDTPERLKDWRDRFGGGPGWSLVTGAKREVDQLLKQLQVFSADLGGHAPFVIYGSQAEGWLYLNGLTAPDTLVGLLTELLPKQADDLALQANQAAAHYFPNTVLIDQAGTKHRLFSDLMDGKVVIINTFFSTCKGVCTVTMDSMAKLAEDLGPRLGKEVFILSFSVDPETDTPERLGEYAKEMGIEPGWYLLTGEKANLDGALQKLGQYTEVREGHSNLFILGNLRTGLWKKAFGLAPVEKLRAIVNSVVEDAPTEVAP